MSEGGSELALIKLGLTSIQAKVYIALNKLGNTNIKTISNSAKLDRANLYRTISQLQDIGLVQLLLGKPNTYRALSIQDAIQLLLLKKTQEFDEIKKDTLKTIKRLKVKEIQNYPINDDSFQIAPGGGQEIVFMTAFNKTRSSYDGIAKSSDLLKWIIAASRNNVIMKLLRRGINFRFVLFNDVQKTELLKVLERKKTLTKLKGTLKIRLVDYLPEAVLGIIDGKEVFIHTKPLPDWVGTPCLRSNNVCLVGITNKYFEALWSKAETLSQTLQESRAK